MNRTTIRIATCPVRMEVALAAVLTITAIGIGTAAIVTPQMVNAQLSGGSSCTNNPSTAQGFGCGSGAGGGSTISTFGGAGGSTQSGDFGGGEYNPNTGTATGCTTIPQRDQGAQTQQTCEGNTSSHP
jgi:hypothetical protein